MAQALDLYNTKKTNNTGGKSLSLRAACTTILQQSRTIILQKRESASVWTIIHYQDTQREGLLWHSLMAQRKSWLTESEQNIIVELEMMVRVMTTTMRNPRTAEVAVKVTKHGQLRKFVMM